MQIFPRHITVNEQLPEIFITQRHDISLTFLQERHYVYFSIFLTNQQWSLTNISRSHNFALRIMY